MKITRDAAPAVLGVAAALASSVLLILQIVLAQHRSNPASPTRIAAIISVLFEATALVLIFWLLFTSIRRDSEKKVSRLFFGGGIALCIVADVVTVATFICLSSNKDLGNDTPKFLAGGAVILVVTFITQLLFFVVRFITHRGQTNNRSISPSMQEIGWPGANRVKTIPYSQTSPLESASRDASVEFRPPQSSSGFSATDTISSLASTITNVVRPISSRTRLLSGNRSLRSQRSQRSQRSVKRPPSLDSVHHRERSNTIEESFDTWDTSNVDPQNRQTVLDTSSPANGSRFLETIPASPTTSRSPSPGTPLDLDPPRRAARRSRSFSPVSTRTQLARPQRSFTQQTSASESHIHPLFRSDSPTPPPLATPGTVVIAAPQAGQVISDRQSIRSLSRMRSGSLPAVSSPLNTKASFESFPHGNPKSFSTASDESRSDESIEEMEEVPERKITPPIPEYILNAGSRTSLHGYQVRKTQSRDGPSGPGLEALPTSSWQ